MIKRFKKSSGRRHGYGRATKDDSRSSWRGARRRRRRQWLGLAVLLLIVAAGGAYASGYGVPDEVWVRSQIGDEALPSSARDEAVAGEGEDEPTERPTPEQIGAAPETAAYGAVAPELPGAEPENVEGVYKSERDPSWASVYLGVPEEESTYVVFLEQAGGPSGDLWEPRSSIRADEPENPDYEKVVLDEAGVPEDLVDDIYDDELSAETVDSSSLPDVEKLEIPEPELSTDEVPEAEREEVEEGLEEARGLAEIYATKYGGVAGVYAHDLEGNFGYGINEDETFFGASVVKVPLMIAVFRKIDEGEFSLSDRFATEAGDWAGGAGWLRWREPGTVHSVEDYLYMMMTNSDNVATNALLRLVGGPGYVNEVAASLGAEDTMLRQKVTSERAAVTGLDNVTTPRDMTMMLAQIMYGEAASKGGSRKMVEIMSQNDLQSSLKDGIPKDVDVANKGGWLYKVYNDVGIVWEEDRPYVVAILSKHGSEDVEVGKALMKGLSKSIFEAQGGSGTPRSEERIPRSPIPEPSRVPETPDPVVSNPEETPELNTAPAAAPTEPAAPPPDLPSEIAAPA